MNLTIRERKLSFASEYDITGSAFRYYARKSIFSFFDKLKLQTESSQVAARIRGHFSPFRSKHDFLFSDGRVYKFHCEKILKRVYACEGNDGCYRLYGHRGLRYSIFYQERQIASIAKNRLVIGKGNQYEIRMDSNADVLIVLCLMLAVNCAEYDNDREAVSVDYGSIGPEEKPFDRFWTPF